MPTAKRATKAVKPPPPEQPKSARKLKLRGRLVPVTVGIPPEKLALLDRAAARETRSRNNLIDAWLTEMLEQKGYSVRGGGA
jgi:hypothetical protein